MAAQNGTANRSVSIDLGKLATPAGALGGFGAAVVALNEAGLDPLVSTMVAGIVALVAGMLTALVSGQVYTTQTVEAIKQRCADWETRATRAENAIEAIRGETAALAMKQANLAMSQDETQKLLASALNRLGTILEHEGKQ